MPQQAFIAVSAAAPLSASRSRFIGGTTCRCRTSRPPRLPIYAPRCSLLERLAAAVAVAATTLLPLPVRAVPAPCTAVASPSAGSARGASLYRAAAAPVKVRPVHKKSFALSKFIPRRSDSRGHVALKCALLVGSAAAVVTAITIAVFWVIQDSLVYKPTKVWRGTPKSAGMPYYEDVNYCTFDGVEISGWFIRQPPESFSTARTMIYFHGTDKNASFRLKKVIGFYEGCKCNILLLSYRGYGLSSGKPNERGMCIDAESAYDYLESRGDVDVAPGGNLWVYGESLGGAVAIHFTKVYQRCINALILENTFTSLLDMIKLEFPILGVFRYLSRNKWQSKHRIRDIAVPILFLSGLRDSYIPPAMMKQMHQLADKSTMREFVEFEKGTHNRTWTMDGFYEAAATFMDRVDDASIGEKSNGSSSADVSGSDEGEFVRAAA